MPNGTERLQNKLDCLILTSATEKIKEHYTADKRTSPVCVEGGYLFIPPFPAFLRPPELPARAAGTAAAEQPLRSGRTPPPAPTAPDRQQGRERGGEGRCKRHSQIRACQRCC